MTGIVTAERTAGAAHTRSELLGVRSVVGAIAVVAVLTAMSAGLRALDDAARTSAVLSVGEPTQVSDTVAFTPAAGWELDTEQSQPGLAIVADKDGWEIKVAIGLQLQPGQTLEDFAGVFVGIGSDDPSAVVSDLQSFTTTSGLHGVWWEVHGAERTVITWQIASGTAVTQILTDGPSSTLDSIEPELQAMAASLTMTDGAGS